jgi:hypothetical protein
VSAMKPRLWPLAPLLAAAGYRTLHPFAVRVRASGESVASAAALGLTDSQADRWAVRCGLHPGLVWDTWYEAGLLSSEEWLLMGSTPQAGAVIHSASTGFSGPQTGVVPLPIHSRSTGELQRCHSLAPGGGHHPEPDVESVPELPEVPTR